MAFTKQAQAAITTKPSQHLPVGVGKSHTDRDLGFLQRNLSDATATQYVGVVGVWPAATQEHW